MDSMQIRVLFCDNEPGRHEIFLRYVVPFLQERFSEYELLVDHSQSLEEGYEDDYSPSLKEKGAKSFSTFMKRKWKGDLVISDIDFFKKVEMGSPLTGFEILKKLASHSRRLWWCEALLITRYYAEQDHKPYIKAGALMPGRWSVVDLTGEPEKNWELVRASAIERLEDAIAIRRPLDHPPSLYRVRLFQSLSEEAVCLTVWSKDEETCFYSRTFYDYDCDILIALGRQGLKFISMRPLTQAVETETKGRRGTKDLVSEDNIRTRIGKIRQTFGSDSSRAETPELRRAGKIHDAKHLEGSVCGGCVIFSPKHHGEGYAFGGDSVLIELPDDDEVSLDMVMRDPLRAWRQFGNDSAQRKATAKL